MPPAPLAARFLVALALARAASGAEPSPEAPGKRTARLSMALMRPMRIASQSLGDPRCAALLEEYRDGHGGLLRVRLSAGGRSAREHLDAIVFVEGTSGPCRRPAVAAWTSPGSSRVVVCIDQFERLSRHSPRRAAAVLIHELLHTLGLPEGPPSSASITTGVTARCGL